ncbi:alpha/beta hydrolase family protein, partial [Streptomyces boncukensis]
QPGAPVAEGAFPVCNFTHGYTSSPQNSEAVIRPLAAAGFVVPAPHFQFDFDDVYSGRQSLDVSEILTRTLALNESDDPLAGHIDPAAGVGVSGHSLGGMTTHGLLTAWPDDRVTAAIPMSTVDLGDPDGTVAANVLFIHGDRDSTCPIAEARRAYGELPAPKAFLTFLGGSHTSFWGDSRTPATFVDWMRWSLYGDTAARDRLPEDAAGDDTAWEFVQERADGA